MSNERTIAQIIMIFSEEFERFKMTEHRRKLWTMMTDGISSDSLLAAAYKIVAENDNWPPTVGMLRTTALALESGSLTPPTGVEAWEMVTKALSNIDASAKALGPRTQRALAAIGGLHALRYTEAESGTRFQADRALFIKTFDVLVQKEKEQRDLLPFVRTFMEGKREPANDEKVPELTGTVGRQTGNDEN
jgi:hypothetical protein